MAYIICFDLPEIMMSFKPTKRPTSLLKWLVTSCELVACEALLTIYCKTLKLSVELKYGIIKLTSCCYKYY